ncbi:MAG: DUF5320 domain-containing protein [Bacillota bacterium]
MPGFRGTGPAGKGPMTGRGRGYCIGYVGEGNVASVANYQSGMRRRRHLCWSNNVPPVAEAGGLKVTDTAFIPTDTNKDDLTSLKNQALNLESYLANLKKAIEQIEKKQS